MLVPPWKWSSGHGGEHCSEKLVISINVYVLYANVRMKSGHRSGRRSVNRSGGRARPQCGP